MVKTYGLTHVAVAVRNLDRTESFYAAILGAKHLGFRLTKEKDIDAARAAVKKAGGTITGTGEFIPGEPYLFATDPDGYTIEIWYEIPTPVDPK